MRKPIFAGLFILAGAAAFAHSGVQNQAVMARMDSMKSIGDAMKVLGRMAKGQTTFDASAAQAAAANIARHSAETPALFEARETDPKSEAKPAIWTDFADFTAKAEALESAALDVSNSLTTPDDLVPAVQRLGEACKSCHSLYRE
ncbi:c-type cytochrome [Mameliella sp.]|uniref:c-type cytochrome n=1 Tax=Mameliella sp. TaxID=1924940 RepID=UPI003B504711